MEQSTLPESILRKISPSTSLSYLCSKNPPTNPRILYIFIHGWACAATDYAPLLAALSSLDQIKASHSNSDSDSLYAALDLPGHGSSPQNLCPDPTVPTFAALVNAFRYELSPNGVLETFLVGHSMGCRIALEALSQEPRNVEGIVLIDGSWAGRHTEAHEQPVLDDREAELRRIALRIGMYGPKTPEAFKSELERRLGEVDLKYEYALSSNYINWDGDRMEEVLEDIGQSASGLRVLIVQATDGRGAKRTGLKIGEEGTWLPFVREKVGSSNFEGMVVEGCGHWPHVDKAEEVARIIRSFGAKNGCTQSRPFFSFVAGGQSRMTSWHMATAK